MRLLVRGVGAALIALASVAQAQATAPSRPASPKVWAMLSAGRGDLQVNCGICRRTDQSSWAADIGIGGWRGKRVALGGEFGAWRLGGEEATQRVMFLGAIAQFYPLQQARPFVKLGVGVMEYRASDGEQSLYARSLTLQAGFGWDILVRGRYTIAPHAGLVQGFNGGLYLDDTRVTGASQVKLLRFGLGVGVGR